MEFRSVRMISDGMKVTFVSHIFSDPWFFLQFLDGKRMTVVMVMDKAMPRAETPPVLHLLRCPSCQAWHPLAQSRGRVAPFYHLREDLRHACSGPCFAVCGFDSRLPSLQTRWNVPLLMTAAVLLQLFPLAALLGRGRGKSSIWHSASACYVSSPVLSDSHAWFHVIFTISLQAWHCDFSLSGRIRIDASCRPKSEDLGLIASIYLKGEIGKKTKLLHY